MQKIEVLTIDDEPLALQQLEAYIRKIPFFHLLASCLSAKEAWEVMEKHTVDVMFCDINMPDINGLDFVRSLDTPPFVVFTTAYSEYAIEGYQANALDYLLKPFSLEEFQRVASKVKKAYDITHKATDTQQQEASETTNAESATTRLDENDDFFVHTEYKMVRIPVSDIVYVEGMSEYLKIHTRNGQKPVVILQSMKTLEDRLPKTFMRIHRSFLINSHCIMEMNKTRVYLGNDISLPLGDMYRDKLIKYVNDRAIGKK